MRYVRVGDAWVQDEGAAPPDRPRRKAERRGRGKTGSGPCPGCGGPGIPWVFGFPGADLVDAAERGEVILGGCIPPFEPTCPNCGAPMTDGRGEPDWWQRPSDPSDAGAATDPSDLNDPGIGGGR